jgi:hypothetical protein
VALCLAGEAAGDRQVNLKLLREPLPTDEEEEATQPRNQPKPKLQPWTHGALLPVRVILRDWVAWPDFPAVDKLATADHLWRFLEHELQRAGIGECTAWLHNQLKDQGGLILLDGLDETPEADQRRVQIKKAILAFTQGFNRCRFLVSGRPYAYQEPAWQLDGFAVAELAPFSRGQIRRFIEKWYAQRSAVLKDDPDKARLRAKQLKAVIENNPRLYELAERPLLLTLTASLHASRQGELPEGRAELYHQAVELLLLRWEDRLVRSDRAEPLQQSLSQLLGVERRQLLTVLQALAYTAHADQPSLTGVADIDEGQLLAALQKLLRQHKRPDIPSERLIHYLKNRSGLLIERRPGVYAAPHRTFQEFLAACHLERLDFPYEIARLARREPNRWREVALLSAAHARNPFAIWSLAEKLWAPRGAGEAANAPAWGSLLAGQTVEESIAADERSREEHKLATLRQQLVQVIEGRLLPAAERALAGRVLAKLGDRRPAVMTIDEMEFCAIPGGEFYRTAKHEHAQLPAFWLGRWPVSNVQFAKFMANGGYQTERFWLEAQQAKSWTKAGFRGQYDDVVRSAPVDYGEPFNLPNHPVVGVTWYEAVAFCRWLSEQLGAPGWQVRLPSEAEWEKAVVGGWQLPSQPQRMCIAQRRWEVDKRMEMIDTLSTSPLCLGGRAERRRGQLRRRPDQRYQCAGLLCRRRQPL